MQFGNILRTNYNSAPSCFVAENIASDYDRFHLPLERMRNRMNHGVGVLAGMQLSASADGSGMHLSAGVALDAGGRMILLADDGQAFVGSTASQSRVPVFIPLPENIGPSQLSLTIEFNEETEPINPNRPSGCKQIEPRPILRLRAVDFVPESNEIAIGLISVGRIGGEGEGNVGITEIAPLNRLNVATSQVVGDLIRSAVESQNKIRLLGAALEKANERARHRTDTFLPRFRGLWFKDGTDAKFSSVPTPVINRTIFSSMQIVLPHAVRLKSVRVMGQISEADESTRIQLRFTLLKWLMNDPEPHATVTEFGFDVVRGAFQGGIDGLDEIINNANLYYELEIQARWVPTGEIVLGPFGEEANFGQADPTLRVHSVEFSYEMPKTNEE